MAHGGGEVGVSGGRVPGGSTDSAPPRGSGEEEKKSEEPPAGSDSAAMAHWKKIRAEVRESHDSFGDSPPTSARAQSSGERRGSSRSPASQQRVSTYGQGAPFQRDGSRRHSEMLARSSAD